MEEWKKVEGYDNYSVSNFGNIRNDKTNKILKPYLYKGYYQVELYKNSIRKHFNIHRLVGLHFLDKIEEKETIDHIDRNPSNNHIDNLRYANHSEQRKNQNKRKNCSSNYRGVSFDKSKNKWFCCIKINKKTFYLGRFDNELECAKKYNEYIIENKLEGYELNNIN